MNFYECFFLKIGTSIRFNRSIDCSFVSNTVYAVVKMRRKLRNSVKISLKFKYDFLLARFSKSNLVVKTEVLSTW